MREIDGNKMREMEAQARELGRFVDGLLNPDSVKRLGFALMIFSFDGPEFTWLSNAQRADMLKALKEFIAKCESGEASQTWTGRN